MRSRRCPVDPATVAEDPSAHVERTDSLNLAVIESEQAAKGIAVAKRGGPPEPQTDILGMQESTELDATRMIGHLYPAHAHGAEAAEGAAAGCGIGDGLKVAAVEADIFQCARISARNSCRAAE
jgi:hypothetical protein